MSLIHECTACANVAALKKIGDSAFWGVEINNNFNP